MRLPYSIRRWIRFWGLEALVILVISITIVGMALVVQGVSP